MCVVVRHAPFPTINSFDAIYHFISWGLSPLRRLKEEAR